MAQTMTISPTEHIVVRSSTPELLEMEVTYQQGARRPPEHWHPNQDEHFEVLEGAVHAIVGGEHRELVAGETIDVPRRTVHQFYNPGPGPARVRWQVRPGGRTEQWFASIDAVHRAGRAGRAGRPGMLAFAVLLTEFRDVFRLATPVPGLVRAALAMLAVIGRLRGYRPAPRQTLG